MLQILRAGLHLKLLHLSDFVKNAWIICQYCKNGLEFFWELVTISVLSYRCGLGHKLEGWMEMNFLWNEISRDRIQFDSLWILVHMHHLISMQYLVIQSVITGLKCFKVKHIHTHTTHTDLNIWVHICIHVHMTLWLLFFFSLACVWLFPILQELEKCSLPFMCKRWT